MRAVRDLGAALWLRPATHGDCVLRLVKGVSFSKFGASIANSSYELAPPQARKTRTSWRATLVQSELQGTCRARCPENVPRICFA